MSSFYTRVDVPKDTSGFTFAIFSHEPRRESTETVLDDAGLWEHHVAARAQSRTMPAHALTGSHPPPERHECIARYCTESAPRPGCQRIRHRSTPPSTPAAGSCTSPRTPGTLHASTKGFAREHVRGVHMRRCSRGEEEEILWACRAAQRSPLYSMPHLSLAMTGLPVKSFKNGFGLTGTIRRGAGSTRRSVVCAHAPTRGEARKEEG